MDITELRLLPTPNHEDPVFKDIGFPEAQAESLVLRAKLMSEIREVARGTTQAQAAAVLRIELRVRNTA